MDWQIWISSVILSLVCLLALAWKWKIDFRIAAIAAVVIGSLTGFIVTRIFYTPLSYSLPLIIILELVFIFLISAIAALYRFFRDPDRRPAEVDNVILSPADGKIIYISPVEKQTSLVVTKGKRQFALPEIASSGMLSDASYLIGIEMNLLNVHVNRSPIRGKIILQKHIHGNFISLGQPEAEIINERVSTILDNGKFRIGVIQIASRLVRRIVSYLNEGDSVDIGQRIGMIRFGSQVDVAVPRIQSLSITVKPGDIVKAGLTVVARYE